MKSSRLRFSFRSVCSSRAVRQLDYGYRRDGDLSIADIPGNVRQDLASGSSLPFSLDEYTGVENQSHSGGCNASRWLSIPSLTSLAKSASITAVESSGSRAIQSEIRRRGGVGAWTTATGSLLSSFSITTSAPARTRASTAAKSRSASASEIWTTSSATAWIISRHVEESGALPANSGKTS